MTTTDRGARVSVAPTNYPATVLAVSGDTAHVRPDGGERVLVDVAALAPLTAATNQPADALTVHVDTADSYGDGLIHVTVDHPTEGVLQELTLPPHLVAELARQLTAATAPEPEASPADPIFYTLPATALEEGMSTDDGQDVLDVTVADDGTVYASVYTRRSDDEEQDAENLSQPETRIYGPGERVDLAVFADTDVDGTEHPAADILSIPGDTA